MNDNREHEQFTFLYKKYYSELYYFARKVLGSDDVAEDISIFDIIIKRFFILVILSLCAYLPALFIIINYYVILHKNNIVMIILTIINLLFVCASYRRSIFGAIRIHRKGTRSADVG